MRKPLFSKRMLLRAALVLVVCAIAVTGWMMYRETSRTTAVAYFTNADGLYAGDDVLMLGIEIGSIDKIEPFADGMRVEFHYDASVQVPAEAKAVILSPTLVSSRAIQLTPAYTGGPELADGGEIPITRTAVPVEWDDFRKQLTRLADSLGPTAEQAQGPLGSAIESAATAMSGNGDRLNRTITQLSEAMATLSDGRTDLFAVIRNLQVFVSALATSEQQIVEINGRLASVTGMLTGTDHDLSDAVRELDTVSTELRSFVADNRDGAVHVMDRLASITEVLDNNRPILENILHVAPNALANFNNIYNPAQGALTGALALNQMSNPVQFICSAVQAASQLGADESARLCAQYLAPVLQSLQVNYPPIGVNVMNGVNARPEQVDYSEPAMNPYPSGAPPAAVVGPGAGLAGLLPGAGR